MTSDTHYREAKKIASNYGLNIYRSDKKYKKYMFLNPVDGRIVHFGDTRYDDYLSHGDDIRRENYRRRHENILLANGKPAYKKRYSPAWASYHILW